ncbi:MAG: 3-dehydroquinate synthase [Candidatus Peribacteraceae bacterium]
MPTLTLTPPARTPAPYPIVIGKGAVGQLPAIIKKLDPADQLVILFDRRMEAAAKEIATIVSTQNLFPIESGEKSKTLAELERLAAALLEIGATKSAILLTVGGGMVTDLGGFLGSIFMRGIRVIHVPTSMLAMVDAAIGGKTAVEVGVVKNVLGTIHHPSAVVADTDMLEHLPALQLHEGIVEVVKEAAMLDGETFAWLEKAMPEILAREELALTRCISEGVRMKAAVVQADDRDVSHRHFLNFGHTVGHAVEALSRFSISHGRAVSIGMTLEMRIAKTQGEDRVIALLKAMNMPVDLPADFDPKELWQLIQSDKKKKGGVVRLFVPRVIGKGVMQPLSEEVFFRAIR